MNNRRRLIRAVPALSAATVPMGLGFAGLPLTAGAQEKFPEREVRLVIPFPPGGPTDLFGRLLGERLTDVLGQTVVIENKPGASGIIASEFVARAKPDGYTLVFGTAATHAVNATLYRKLPYHPLKDFEAVAFVGVVPAVLLVHPSLPSAWPELLALLKANPGKYTYGSAGNGTTNHLGGEMLKAEAGVKMLHVAYKGSGPAMQDVLGGQIHMMFETFGTALPHIKAGRLRAVAVAAEKRSTAAPDVPTFAEVGLPNLGVSTWNVVMAPSGTPADVVRRLNQAVNESLRDPALGERLVKLGIVAVSDSTPASTAQTIQLEIDKWAKAVELAGVKLD